MPGLDQLSKNVRKGFKGAMRALAVFKSKPDLSVLLADDVLELILRHICNIGVHDRQFLEELGLHQRRLPMLVQLCRVSKRFRMLVTPFLYHCVARPAKTYLSHLSHTSSWEFRLARNLALPAARERFQHTRIVDAENMSIRTAQALSALANVRSVRVSGPSYVFNDLLALLQPKGLLLFGSDGDLFRFRHTSPMALDWITFEPDFRRDYLETPRGHLVRDTIRSLTIDGEVPVLANRLLQSISADHLLELDLRADTQQGLVTIWRNAPYWCNLTKLTLRVGSKVNDLGILLEKIPGCTLHLAERSRPGLGNNQDPLYGTIAEHITGFCPDLEAILRSDICLLDALRHSLAHLKVLLVPRQRWYNAGGSNFALLYQRAIRRLEHTCQQRERPVSIRAAT